MVDISDGRLLLVEGSGHTTAVLKTFQPLICRRDRSCWCCICRFDQ